MKKTKNNIYREHESYLLIGSFLTALALILTSCSPYEKFNDWLGWKDENILEETLEFVIDKSTGIDVDLTPRSKE